LDKLPIFSSAFAREVYMETLINIDLNIVIWIKESLQNDLLSPFWIFLTTIGDMGIIWILIALALLIHPKTRRLGLLCTGALFFSGLLCNLGLKPLVMRPRPFNYFDAQLLIKAPHDYSFPSGHTSASFAVAYILFKEKFRIRTIPVYIWTLILAILISLSRLYLSVHFPSDILVGIFTGCLSGYLSLMILNRVDPNHKI